MAIYELRRSRARSRLMSDAETGRRFRALPGLRHTWIQRVHSSSRYRGRITTLAVRDARVDELG